MDPKVHLGPQGLTDPLAHPGHLVSKGFQESLESLDKGVKKEKVACLVLMDFLDHLVLKAHLELLVILDKLALPDFLEKLAFLANQGSLANRVCRAKMVWTVSLATTEPRAQEESLVLMVSQASQGPRVMTDLRGHVDLQGREERQVLLAS